MSNERRNLKSQFILLQLNFAKDELRFRVIIAVKFILNQKPMLFNIEK